MSDEVKLGFHKVDIIKMEFNYMSGYALEDLIKHSYSLTSFDILAINPNTAYVCRNVKKGSYLYNKESLDTYLESQSCEYDQIVFLLHALCEHGFIEEGDYIINLD